MSGFLEFTNDLALVVLLASAARFGWLLADYGLAAVKQLFSLFRPKQ